MAQEEKRIGKSNNSDASKGSKAKLSEAARGEGSVASGGDSKPHQDILKGNSAGVSGRYQGSSGRTREDEDLTSISRQSSVEDKGLEDIQHEELSGPDNERIESVNYSDTDEDENEGLGDGKLGRNARRGLE